MENFENAEKIAALNDVFRKTFIGGQVLVTSGIQALEPTMQARIYFAVSNFTDFNPDNDPHLEHDCASLKVGNHNIIWKIDYYDLNMTYRSEDPSDPKLTKRVLTIMLASEY